MRMTVDMRARAAKLVGTLMLAAVAMVTAAGPLEAAPGPGSTHFPRYKELESNVAFWSDVFTKWTSRQIAFHDVEHLDLIYSVLSVDDIVTRLPAGQQDAAISARRKAEGERISAMLTSISDGHARTEEERRVLKAIARIGHEPSYATKLAEQVRSQRGLGDRFCEAAARAESYRPMMSRILASHGVPQELLALPLVESGYKIGARSSAGASGIWQFMPATGRTYLTVSSSYDDRRDPVRSTDAAARMLRRTYDNLGSWPLAITSYNHGPGGIARAVKDMGTTHFGVISRHYKGKAFGFASRNYYAEFLAAADAMKRVDELCGDLDVETYAPDEATLGASASIRDLARAAGVSVEKLGELNPALSDSCLRGSAKIPRGYRLNLPRGTRNDFAVAFGHVDRDASAAPVVVATLDEDDAEDPAVKPAVKSHRVARGETLAQIARRYGTTETTLVYMNRLRDSKSVKLGQTLKVPDRAAAPTAVAAVQPERPPFSRTMTTTAGVIAAKEAGAIAARAAENAAETAAAAVPAAVIQKDAPAAEARPAAEPAEAETLLTAEHKVGRGQTLSQIASMYRTSIDDLKKMNGLTDTASIQAGQVLKVKASGSEIVAGATVGRTYKVRSGDTLWTVAKANDTSVETLKRLNPKVGAAGLKAGDTIKVPSAGAVATTVASADRQHAPAKASAKSSAKVSSSSSSKTASKAPVAKASKPSAKSPSKTAFRSHRVQKGQTLSSIAARYKTSVDTLKRLNGIRDASHVQVGKTLKVPL
jgi:membrane-bound lytic murein transglycosylase D